MAAAVTLLRLPLARFSTHIRSIPLPRLAPPRLRVARSYSLGRSPAAAAASEVVAAPNGEGYLIDAAEQSRKETPVETEAAEEAPRSFVLPRLPRPKLTVKERKELASYAHSLGKKLKSQQVGKSGVTPSLVSAFTDNLESNELLKVCPIWPPCCLIHASSNHSRLVPTRRLHTVSSSQRDSSCMRRRLGIKAIVGFLH
jgi:RNA-binding protein